jgi:phospholipase/carboxylesterase
MTMTAALASSHHMPLSCGKPAWLVVLLHAHGADAEHILELAVEWAPHLLKAEFIALQAPLSLPGASHPRHWFECEADGTPNMASLDAAAAAVLATAEGWLAERKLGPQRLALLGFGAGATLALHAGLSRPDIGAIVAVAGGVVTDRGTGAVRTPPQGASAEALPELLLVQSADAVPAGTPDVATSADLLAAAGWAVTRQTSPGDWHGLEEEGIHAMAHFLKAALTREGPASAHDHDDDHDHNH